jgi:hypothetical protein
VCCSQKVEKCMKMAQIRDLRRATATADEETEEYLG